ncbi:hypothetical protein I4U23_003239 [Adineta vaga]|nr:hypothetical protein I4U23_003239 [Adineta vaga]
MTSKESISSVLYYILRPFSIGSHSFFSQFLMISTIFVLFVAFLPYVSSSPTPSLNPLESVKNMDRNSEPSMYDSLASAPLPSTYDQKNSAPSSSSSVWFGQPRTHANQFLMSHSNENEMTVPKWFTRLNQNAVNDDDGDDYTPFSGSVNKRSSFYTAGGHQTLKKRKQINKPPMEVMNEIVNSIYLR